MKRFILTEKELLHENSYELFSSKQIYYCNISHGKYIWSTLIKDRRFH